MEKNASSNYPTLGSGTKPIQRRIPASGLLGSGNQSNNQVNAVNPSANSSNYGKNSSSKRFEYRWVPYQIIIYICFLNIFIISFLY